MSLIGNLQMEYLRLLSTTLPIINTFNKFMQQESPVLHVLHQELNGLVRRLLLRFMKSEHVLTASSITEVEIKEEHYLPLEDVFVGHITQQYDRVFWTTYLPMISKFLERHAWHGGVLLQKKP